MPGVQLDRFCGSGLEAVNSASARVRAGFADLIVAGGVESMSRVPMGSAGGAIMLDPATAWAADFVPQGVAADLLATLNGLTREELDTYAATSHARASQAWEAGRFARSIVPVRDRNGLVVLDRDELVQPGTTPKRWARSRRPSRTRGPRGSMRSLWSATTGSTRSGTCTTRATPAGSQTAPLSC